MQRVLILAIAMTGCLAKSSSVPLAETTSDLKPYCAAEVYAYEQFTYGRIEARMRPSKVSGLVTALFTFGALDHWTEIDIEFLGRHHDKLQAGIVSGESPDIAHGGQLVGIPELDETFHDYAFEWTPDYVRWLVDDQEISRRVADDPQVAFIRDSTQSIHLNFWPSRSPAWAGAIDETMLPARAEYDWVRYSSYSRRPDGTAAFELQWQDDFDSFDSSRWGLASWTFEGNDAQFHPSQATVENGLLVLTTRKRNLQATNAEDSCR